MRRLVDALQLDESERAASLTAARAALASPGDVDDDGQLRPNVPLSLTSFIGRAHELAEIQRLLQTTRLLTLSGPGGIGETRLALQLVEAQASDRANDVSFVDLSPLADASLVEQTVAAGLGVWEQPGRTLTTTLIPAVRERKALLVLDNCEHVLDECARLVEALLRGCAHLNVLATSRETLRVPGEVVWQVPPLTLPESQTVMDPERLIHSEAVRLFVERAQSRRAGFTLRGHNAAAIAHICQRLDGMPLAIELAAARATVLSAEEIAELLTDRFALLNDSERTAHARHRTLRAAIEWSYKLLDPAEQVMFDQLSVFAGGWSLDAVAFICGDELLSQNRLSVLDILTHLVDASLVSVEERDGAVRYRQLETLRAYGEERVAASHTADVVRSRHATYFVELAEALAPQADGLEHSGWMRQVASEYDNLRRGLNWLAAHDPARALRMAVAVGRYWYLRGLVSEGCGWLEDLLAHASERGETWGRERSS